MRNKYPGICYKCNKLVEIGKGHFEKILGTRNSFRVQHAGCVGTNIKHQERQLKMSKKYMVLDTKTSSLEPGQICQLSYIIFDANFKIYKTFNQYFNV